MTKEEVIKRLEELRKIKNEQGKFLLQDGDFENGQGSYGEANGYFFAIDLVKRID